VPVPFIALPAVGSLAELVLADGRAQPVRAVGAAGFRLTVAASLLAVGVTLPSPDDLLTLRWAGRRGRCAAPCRVRTVHPDRFATWTVEPVGTVEVEQRRRFSRAAGSGPVHLGPAEPDVGVVLVGELIDIGTGGLRCLLATGGVDPDQPVFLRLLLDGQLVTLPGAVRRLDPVAAESAGFGAAGPSVAVAVEFQADPAQAAVIGRYVRRRQPRPPAGLPAGAASDGAG